MKFIFGSNKAQWIETLLSFQWQTKSNKAHEINGRKYVIFSVFCALLHYSVPVCGMCMPSKCVHDSFPVYILIVLPFYHLFIRWNCFILHETSKTTFQNSIEKLHICLIWSVIHYFELSSYDPGDTDKIQNKLIFTNQFNFFLCGI